MSLSFFASKKDKSGDLETSKIKSETKKTPEFKMENNFKPKTENMNVNTDTSFVNPFNNTQNQQNISGQSETHLQNQDSFSTNITEDMPNFDPNTSSGNSFRKNPFETNIPQNSGKQNFSQSTNAQFHFDENSQNTMQNENLNNTGQNFQNNPIDDDNNNNFSNKTMEPHIGNNLESSNWSLSSERIQELIEESVEKLIEEKWNKLIESVEKVLKWKEKEENQLILVKEDILNIQDAVEKIEIRVMNKVSSYDKNLLDVNSEIRALEKVFQKITPTLVNNVNELSRIAEDLKTLKINPKNL